MRAWTRSRELRMILSKILEEEPIEAILVDLNIQDAIVNNIESENQHDEIQLPEALPSTSRATVAIASSRDDIFDPMTRVHNTPVRQFERLTNPLPRLALNEDQEDYERYIRNRLGINQIVILND